MYIKVFACLLCSFLTLGAWAHNNSCYSDRDCMCIAESTPICKKSSGSDLGVCGCIAKPMPKPSGK
ncbi:MAG: hypothetical protein NXI01_09925 [Gammaproteobacteria bacterium]|nr:hypothetical protein [Gammaproteobacteria bacterium]